MRYFNDIEKAWSEIHAGAEAEGFKVCKDVISTPMFRTKIRRFKRDVVEPSGRAKREYLEVVAFILMSGRVDVKIHKF